MEDIKKIVEKYKSLHEGDSADSKALFEYNIVSMAEEMMKSAEQLFGPRDTKFQITAIHFSTPQNDTAPLTVPDPNSPTGRIIYLGDSLETEVIEEAKLRLAHELVHCLAPSQSGNKVIEEGCACANGCFFGSPRYMGEVWESSHKILALLRRWRPTIIKDIRAMLKSNSFPSGISDITSQNIKAFIPDFPEDVIDDLMTAFVPQKGNMLFPKQTPYLLLQEPPQQYK